MTTSRAEDTVLGQQVTMGLVGTVDVGSTTFTAVRLPWESRCR
ncbi:MAG: hypothetical protein ACRDQ5_18625 [Sciscionella sp.]